MRKAASNETTTEAVPETPEAPEAVETVDAPEAVEEGDGKFNLSSSSCGSPVNSGMIA